VCVGLAGIANGYVTLAQAAPLVLIGMSFGLGVTFLAIATVNLVVKARCKPLKTS
jgi:hypothetical protein